MPNVFYLDASALAKRYVPEPGSLIVDHLFAQAPASRLIVLYLGIAETASILLRKTNAKLLSSARYTQALGELGAEIINDSSLRKPTATNDLVNAALLLIRQHSINATDAVLLRSALDIAAALRKVGDDLVLVASDQRLLRAAQAEGLPTFNPETQSTADLDLLLI